VGIDLNPKMVDYARKKTEEEGLADKVSIRQGDMRDPFAAAAAAAADEASTSSAAAAAAAAGPYDLAGVMLGSLGHLLTNEDALKCFRSAYSALRPGGFFVVELQHAGDLFDGSLMDPEVQAEGWEQAEGTTGLEVRWGKQGDEFDYETQVYYRTVEVKVLELGAGFGSKGKVVRRLSEVVPNRVHTYQEVKLLAAAAGFSVEGVFGDFNRDFTLRHEDSYRMICVLKRPEA
jgi:SAM-dependent methyltransferase